ncbi:hypothetical protein K435DRAFT_854025 [Dendrothele bispora CBS 962.96]|uniref:Uncharacterized protein n=1 Tax=Dendrothele bispora (strain CBS 962.96) TaxID=1314807 RepID=A0A4S8MEW4_DENBC|nr:hypothetical protein K435DRAFT_854025 [Dendrothele bispora CBS 962.96]
MSQSLRFQRVRLIHLQPGESVVITCSSSTAQASEIPDDPSEQWTYALAPDLSATDQNHPHDPMPVGVAQSTLPEQFEELEVRSENSQTPSLTGAHNPGLSTPPPSDVPNSIARSLSPPPPPYVVPNVPTEAVRVFAAFNRVPTPNELRLYWPYEESRPAYLVVSGARIAILPTWELTKPLVHGVSDSIFKKCNSFTAALHEYIQCVNRVAPFPYPALRPLSARLCQTPYDLLHPDLNNDIEFALDSHGQVYTYRMGSDESQGLLRRRM